MFKNRKQVDIPDKEAKLEQYAEYCRDRTEILEHRLVNIQLLDKTLLTINTGAFIVSFTYVFQLFGKGNAHWLALLILGWISMGLAIMTNILAQYLALRLCNARLIENDLSYKCESGRCDVGEEEQLSKVRRSNMRYDKVSNFLSNSQVILTTLSIILILIFVSINAYLFPK